tara:strand:+ start:1987 stop:2148 length:162 start_codon:yes stop_codon:yes gene_type:complete
MMASIHSKEQKNIRKKENPLNKGQEYRLLHFSHYVYEPIKNGALLTVPYNKKF